MKRFYKDAEFQNSVYIHYFSPFRIRFESKEIFIDGGLLKGISTCTTRRVNFENPSNHRLRCVYVARKLANGKFSTSLKRMDLDEFDHESRKAVFAELAGTTELDFCQKIFAEARREFDEEGCRRGSGSVGGGHSERMSRIHGGAQALANCGKYSVSGIPPSAPKVDPAVTAKKEALERQIAHEKHQRDLYGNDSRWIEQKVINNLEHQLRSLTDK